MIEHTAEEKRSFAGPPGGTAASATATTPGKRSGDARPWWRRLAVTLGRNVALLGLIAVAIALGYLIHRAVTPASVVTLADATEESESAQAAQFWTCAMHPTVRLPRPGKCPL